MKTKKVQITPEAQQNISGLGIKFSSGCSKEEEEEFWEDGVITRRVRRVMSMVCSTKWQHKRHLNQLRLRFTEDITSQEEVPVHVLYDTFNISTSSPKMVVQ